MSVQLKLKKQESFTALVFHRLGAGVELLRFVRKTPAFKCGEGIIVEQGLRDGFAASFDDGIIGGAKLKRPALQIVRVAGDEVNAIVVQPLLCMALRARAEPPQNGLRGDLHVGALMQPSIQSLGLRAQIARCAQDE